MRSPKYKICRTLGCNLWGREKDPYNFKNYFPGQHGQSVNRVPTQHSIQLRAKQKMRFYYNMREKQFSNTFKIASNKKGDTGENLINLLERRLDIALYRTNIAPTIFAASQLVCHGHVLVDGKPVDIRSYRLRDGQKISLRSKVYNFLIVQDSISKAARRIPEYFSSDEDKKEFTFVRSPSFAEVPYETIMDLNLIIEYYS